MGVSVGGTYVGSSDQIADSIVTNAKVAAAAAIAFSKLAALSSGNILVGSAGGVPTSVSMSGDATMAASGAVTVAVPQVSGSAQTSCTTTQATTSTTYVDITQPGTATITGLVAGNTYTVVSLFNIAGKHSLAGNDVYYALSVNAVDRFGMRYRYSSGNQESGVMLHSIVTGLTGSTSYAVLGRMRVDTGTATVGQFIATENESLLSTYALKE